MNNDPMQSIPGEYYLTGVQEMASGYKLNENLTFEFFFSYGALDRFGSGTWKLVDNHVVLQSSKWSGKDFRLEKSTDSGNNQIVIQFIDTNPAILPYIHASLENGKQGSWQTADSKGTILFKKHEFSTISLAFEFCPERFSIFSIDVPSHNSFTFKPEAWLFEYFFENFQLVFEEGGLKGHHPMLDEKEYHYLK